MGSFKDIFVETKPRELAGSRTSNRLDYQQNYGIYCLLEWHTKGEDYRIFFDYHDDIVILFPANDPSEAHFYQVKTKRNLENWAIGKLIRKSKQKDSLSNMSKLFVNYKNFPEYTQSLNFVSNSKFKVKLIAGDSLSKNTILLTELDEKEITKLQERLKEEISLDIDKNILEKTYLEVSNLNVEEHETYILGRLQEFLAERFNEDDLPGQTLHKTLKNYY